MSLSRALRICRGHGDGSLAPLIRKAAAAGWDIGEYLAAGYAAALNKGGLWECEECRKPVEDPAHPHAAVGCVVMAGSDTVLCRGCYASAVAARAKVVVVVDVDDGVYEDDSALTAEEKRKARYLERNDEGAARLARAFIALYPRNERGQLHRYQDTIDAERSRSAATTFGPS